MEADDTDPTNVPNEWNLRSHSKWSWDIYTGPSDDTIRASDLGDLLC